MKVVYKYTIPLQTSSVIQLPENARFVRAEMSSELAGTKMGYTINLWAVVDTDDEIVGRAFHIYGTGHEVDDEHQYVATVKDRTFYWHIFQDDVL